MSYFEAMAATVPTLCDGNISGYRGTYNVIFNRVAQEQTQLQLHKGNDSAVVLVVFM